MILVLRKAEARDAGAMAEILQGWLEDTPWMPVLHTLADTEAFCGHLTKATDCWVAVDAECMMIVMIGMFNWYVATEHGTGR